MKSKFPEYLKKKGIKAEKNLKVQSILEKNGLCTVCHSARCPNLNECFSLGTATFMILGDTCTRTCRFCAVRKGSQQTPDDTEPERLANAASEMGLRYVVITSVTRDDLPDGGASHFKKTISTLRKRVPGAGIEVLIPDFGGNLQALEKVLSERPNVLNHNIETVPRLYPEIRPEANYRRSLDILKYASEMAGDITVKSGLMLGMGEKREEITDVMTDLKHAGCRILTLGQYLPPGKDYYPVREYIHPDFFEEMASIGEKMGFGRVLAGPFVRSSYHAADLLHDITLHQKRKIKLY